MKFKIWLVLYSESDAISEVVYKRQALEGQRNPTTKKIRFLIHLDACRMSSLQGVCHAIYVLENAKP
jgi:hypothetical protein